MSSHDPSWHIVIISSYPHSNFSIQVPIPPCTFQKRPPSNRLLGSWQFTESPKRNANHFQKILPIHTWANAPSPFLSTPPPPPPCQHHQDNKIPWFCEPIDLASSRLLHLQHLAELACVSASPLSCETLKAGLCSRPQHVVQGLAHSPCAHNFELN